MANIKNTNRSKRKYSENRKSRTEVNAQRRARRNDLHAARLVARTQSLIGKPVAIRVKDSLKPLVGTVSEVLRKGDEEYPIDARRHTGAYMKVHTTFGDYKVSRHRVKPLTE